MKRRRLSSKIDRKQAKQHQEYTNQIHFLIYYFLCRWKKTAEQFVVDARPIYLSIDLSIYLSINLCISFYFFISSPLSTLFFSSSVYLSNLFSSFSTLLLHIFIQISICLALCISYSLIERFHITKKMTVNRKADKLS